MPRPQQGAALGASYRLVEQIGAGAAGDVWRAESSTDGATFAAKILKEEHTSDPELVERFIRERSVLVGLRHRNIVTVRDLVVEGTTLAIIMDYIPGGSLRDLLARRGPLPAGEALQLCAQVFDALGAAHAKRVTHRDIKPDNVLLTETWRSGQEGTVRVSDFGIASVVSEGKSQTTGLLGTPQYMAPELISNGETSSSSDVYSAGVMLYELLAGRTPFAGPGTDFTIAYRHVTAQPPTLDLPDELWSVVARLLAKDPRDRPRSTDAAAELHRLATTFADLPPLASAHADGDFKAVERPATVLRGDLLRGTDPEPDSGYMTPLAAETPDLGVPGQRTLLRPLPKRDVSATSPSAPSEATSRRQRGWLTRKNLILGGAGLVLLAGLGIGSIWLFSGTKGASPAADTVVQATEQDQPLPTGLSVTRKASYDPTTRRIAVELTYTAQKAPLAGAFLEVIPAVASGASCPPAVWEGARATKHQASSTGLKAECGWKLDAIDIPAGGQTTLTASFPATVTDAAELDSWLTEAASATTTALSNPESVSTAYPVQRLQDITVVTPSRTVSQTPLPVTLIPVWPSGPDELNPIYQSPSAGTPSQMLQSIAGGEAGVRFSDNCAGAVAISTDGLVVTALSVTPACSLYAAVGNFTNLQSAPFSITTRE